jgi:hypothetical protein
MSKNRASYIDIGKKCQACEDSRSINRFVLGYITDDTHINLCSHCSKIFENIPDYIPLEQDVKYLKSKINEK